GTLFCSDLFTHVGDPKPLADGDILEPALAAEKQYPFMAVGPFVGATLRRLAGFKPRTLAVMHGSSYTGDVASRRDRLAEHYHNRLRRCPRVPSLSRISPSWMPRRPSW